MTTPKRDTKCSSIPSSRSTPTDQQTYETRTLDMKTTQASTRESAQVCFFGKRLRCEPPTAPRVCARSAGRASARQRKRTAAAALAALGVALGAFAQGSVALDNSLSSGRLCVATTFPYAPGDAHEPYGGPYGLAVYELNSATFDPNQVNNRLFQGPGELGVVGFTLVATFAGLDNTTTPGIINLGELDMPQVNPKGSTVALGLVAWGSSESFDQYFGAGGGGLPFLGPLGGVVFINQTADYTALPKPNPPALSGWSDDLVMYQEIPEPSALLLAALGAAALFPLRRRES